MTTEPAGGSPPGRRTAVAVVALAGLVLAVAAVAPTLVGARPANEIPVPEVDDELTQPGAAGWGEVPGVEVPLSSAPSGVPDAGTTTVRTVDVQAAQTGERLYVRLEWPDATADHNASDPREFADAAAVQVPVNASVRPAIAMGSTRNLVNVWYWSSPVGAQELLAGGPGTTTGFDATHVDVSTARLDGGPEGEERWALVYARDLQPGGQNRTAVTGDHDLAVAFAVWNGSAMERSGRKAVSDWYHLPFGPGPQGPPYAALLWAVAGIAVVAVIAVTVYGIRHARSGGSGAGGNGGGGS
jgi:complex iron-sulfur molybdoenzyme family reductase subunit gamma